MPWQDFCGWLPHEWWLGRTWEGAFLLYQYSVEVVVMDLDGWVNGRVTSPRNGSMGSVQVGKAVFVKENYTTLGIEPRTYSYPGRSGNPYSVCCVIFFFKSTMLYADDLEKCIWQKRRFYCREKYVWMVWGMFQIILEHIGLVRKVNDYTGCFF